MKSFGIIELYNLLALHGWEFEAVDLSHIKIRRLSDGLIVRSGAHTYEQWQQIMDANKDVTP